MNTTKEPLLHLWRHESRRGFNVLLAHLFRCLLVQIQRNEGIQHVGNPHGDDRWHVAVDGKRRGDGLEEDVREAQSQPDAQVQPHAALGLLRRERRPDQRQDEGGKRHGDALVILYLELLDVGKATLLLAVDVFAQLRVGQHLLLVLHDEEVGRLHEERRVDAVALRDFLPHAVHLAYHVVLDDPAVIGRRVVGDAACRQVRHQLLVLELVQREAVARLAVVLEAVDVGNDARVHLQLDVSGRVGLSGLVVLVLEVDARHAALGDDVSAQPEGDHGNDGRRHHVGPQHALEAHARREHRDDFGVLGQLRGEEDDGNEHEQRAEQVGEVGDEVHVVVEDDGAPRRFVRHELVLLLVEVEHHGNRNDERDGKDVRPQELLDDVHVQPLEESASQPGGVNLQLRHPYAFQFFHNLVDTRFTIIGFHVAKSPAMMCLRASPTSHR